MGANRPRVQKRDLTTFIDKFCDALHNDDKELWLTVQPGQELDYIDFDEISDNVDRFVASLFDETSDTDPPGPLGSRSWFEGWLHVLFEGGEVLSNRPSRLAVTGSDWTVGGKKADLISFPEAMGRAEQRGNRDCRSDGAWLQPVFLF